MGRTFSGDDETIGFRNELPVHTVTLSAYEIGKYEVTNQQYCDVLNYAIASDRNYLRTNENAVWTGSGEIYAGDNLQRILAFKDAACNIQFSAGSFSPKTRVGASGMNYSMGTHPVGDVTWYGAAVFCNWLSEIQGLSAVYNPGTKAWAADFANNGYHLPTEAQWERAAAWDGSKHWIYSFTSDTLTANDQVNYYRNNPLGLIAYPLTSPAGWFDGVNVSPNGNIITINSVSPVGCYGMSGNVWEWCHDWFAAYNGAAVIDPQGAASSDNRVFRGGGCYSDRYSCRSAQRSASEPKSASSSRGFRIAR